MNTGSSVEELEDVLFSLELVVEKLFIPYAPCRFPAIVFRLLDFPTILIKHVEDDLGQAIRTKISFDPDYRLPNQFVELKDRNGNFMIKKGKSCLFKISASVLKRHLTQTPLYVMVTDLFPEVPKLVGNSSVPLDSLMESICTDIAKFGSTVPSVHGDKGLFKIYNLMGKEIGYFVLGFRLLCLGPSLIPHLPESALLSRHSRNKTGDKRKIEHMLQEDREKTDENSESEESACELRNSACMTDPMKHDAIIQTIEMDDKAVHVALSEIETVKRVPVSETVPDIQTVKKESFQSVTTQTDVKKKVKEVRNIRQKWAEEVHSRTEHDDIIVNNIICPPPLFYNSEANPPLEIERCPDNLYTSLDELSDIASFDGEGLDAVRKDSKQVSKSCEPNRKSYDHGFRVQNKKMTSPGHHIPQTRPGECVHGLQVAPQPNAIFPILSALINELACIQDPQVLLDASNKIQQRELKAQRIVGVDVQKSEPKQEDEKISPAVVSAVAAALARRIQPSKETPKGTKGEKAKSLTDPDVSDQNAKNVSFQGKKSTLAFGLTHTQRLRLQKNNPAWLKQAEKQAERNKSQKRTSNNIPNLDDINATVFSDTLTEVRRLAKKEMESTAGGDTLRQVASEVEEFNSTLEKSLKKPVRPPRKVSSASPQRASRKSANKSLLSSSSRGQNQVKPKIKPRHRHRWRSHQRDGPQESTDSDDEVPVKMPVPLELISKNIVSPGPQETAANENEEILSARSELASSRSRSIEVHLPSAQADTDHSDTITDVDDEDEDDEDIPLPDDSLAEPRSVQVVNLPRYFSRDMSLPESIDGVPNASLNISGAVDDNSPLESTRHSKNLTEDQNDSHILQSTDYDTKQFHSTDEPELQGLMSEEDKHSETADSGRRSVASVRTSQKFPVINPQLSENSPVPSVRRSMSKLDPGAQSYLPSMSLSKGQLTSPGSSRPGTPKGSLEKNKSVELQTINPKGGVITPRSSRTPRSMSPSPKRPAIHGKRPMRDFRESIHTESLSSYMPSDPDNVIVSLSSNSGNYSDDFQPLGSADSGEGNSAVEQLPKILSNAKLGYTIG